MEIPLLYRQLQDQLRQWVRPKDQRHLQGLAEIFAALLQSGSACLGKWIPYMSHRDCQARAHMERLSYFLHNQQITTQRFYEPMLRHALSAFAGESVLLTLDTSLLWDQFCLIEVCFVWGGRSLTLAQVVTHQVLPAQCQVTLLADRGFEHGNLIYWLQQQRWSWVIRVKSDLKVTLANGQNQSVEQLLHSCAMSCSLASHKNLTTRTGAL